MRPVPGRGDGVGETVKPNVPKPPNVDLVIVRTPVGGTTAFACIWLSRLPMNYHQVLKVKRDTENPGLLCAGCTVECIPLFSTRDVGAKPK
jgi:hypothetical protein